MNELTGNEMNELTIIESLPCVAGGLERIKMAKETAKNLVEELRGEGYSDSVIRDFLEDEIISKPTKMDRSEAVLYYGEDVIEELDNTIAEPTSRLTAGTTDDGLTEYAAFILCGDDVVIAYYYQDNDDIYGSNAVDDLEDLDWVVDHYETK